MNYIKLFEEFNEGKYTSIENRLNNIEDAKENWWDGKFGKEISLRDIFKDTADEQMMIIGIKGSKGKTTKVKLNELIPSQPNVTVQRVLDYIKNPKDELPNIVNYNNKFYINSGHHRLAALMLQNKIDAKVKLHKIK